jgi:hypothetical protein
MPAANQRASVPPLAARAPLPEGSRATDEASGANFIARLIQDDDLLERVQRLKPIAASVDLSLAQLAASRRRV